MSNSLDEVCAIPDDLEKGIVGAKAIGDWLALDNPDFEQADSKQRQS